MTPSRPLRSPRPDGEPNPKDNLRFPRGPASSQRSPDRPFSARGVGSESVPGSPSARPREGDSASGGHDPGAVSAPPRETRTLQPRILRPGGGGPPGNGESPAARLVERSQRAPSAGPVWGVPGGPPGAGGRAAPTQPPQEAERGGTWRRGGGAEPGQRPRALEAGPAEEDEEEEDCTTPRSRPRTPQIRHGVRRRAAPPREPRSRVRAPLSAAFRRSR